MILSHKYKFIFIKTEKTAGTSIEIFLSNMCSKDDVVTPISPYENGHFPRNYKSAFNPITEILLAKKIKTQLRSFIEAILCRKYYNHIPAWRVRERVGHRLWNDYFTFCVERNPWEKFFSNYSMLRKRYNNLSLDQFMKKGSFAINYPKYMDYERKNIIVDKIIRYENLNKELNEVFKKTGIPFAGSLNIYAKKNNVNREKGYKSQIKNLDKGYQEKIMQIYHKEIELFSYTYNY